jgi:hypothetical protein
MKNKIGKLILAERLRTEREIQPPLFGAASPALF